MMPLRESPAWTGIAVVFATWGLAVFLVGVGGEFPLSDDWAYAHVVRSLVDGRGFDFLPWTGASLVVQALYGAAACKLTGFSYVTLRATTLAMSALGIAAFYALLRELGVRREDAALGASPPTAALGASHRNAALGAAMLAFSPLWFHLSFTFMTDLPFAALAIVAAWLYVRSFGRDSRGGLFVAGALAAAAFLIRQHGIWIASAAAMAALVPIPRTPSDPRGQGRNWTTRLADATAAIALPLVTALVYARWATSASAPLAMHNKLGEVIVTSFLPLMGAAFRAVATLGFLVVPLALAIRLEGRAAPRTFAVTLLALAGAALFVFVREGDTMFYLTNVLGDFRVGALTTRDTQFLGHPLLPAAGTGCGIALTTISVASAAALLAALAGARREQGRGALFCVFALVLSGLGTLLQAHYYFDRYLLVLLPLAIASVVAVASPLRPGAATPLRPGAATFLRPGASAFLRPGAASLAAVIALALYAVAGTHDYMAWNRARWELLADLEQRGVSAAQIDGGFEYNAERFAAVLRTSPSDAEARRGQAASVKSWWWVEDDRWVIAFGPLDGYAAAASRDYSRWLPPGRGHVFALERVADSSTKQAGISAPDRH